MRKLVSVTTLALLAVLCLAPAVAGEAKTVTLTGYITDEWCGQKNAGADAKSADCARECAKKGAALVMFEGDTMYTLADKETAMAHVGSKVRVTGTVDDKNVVTISKIERVEDKKG
jgi:hypothetical protein